MNKLNLDDRGVFECEATIGDIRSFFEGHDLPEVLTDALDEAQGFVFGDERVGEAFVVIKVTR